MPALTALFLRLGLFFAKTEPIKSISPIIISFKLDKKPERKATERQKSRKDSLKKGFNFSQVCRKESRFRQKGRKKVGKAGKNRLKRQEEWGNSVKIKQESGQ